jgi:hypothetical protein
MGHGAAAVSECPLTGNGGCVRAPPAPAQDLLRRQEELNRREAQLPQANKKNFPKFYPLVYHNIEEDIPLDKQRVVRLAFYSYLGLCVCLAVNWFAVTCASLPSRAAPTT